MPKTITIRNVDEPVYAALARRAAENGISVPDLLLREAARLAPRVPVRPTFEDWLSRTRHRPSGIAREEVVAALDELRGAWPDTRR